MEKRLGLPGRERRNRAAEQQTRSNTRRFQAGGQGSDPVARHASATAEGMDSNEDDDCPKDGHEDALGV